MAYGTPADPVAGTVITVTWAVTNVLDPIRWLRLLTGNADPPGPDYVVVADSTSATTWKKIPGSAIADGALTTAKYADGSVTSAKMNGESTTSRVLATASNGVVSWQQITAAMVGTNQITGGGSGHLSTAPGLRVAGVNMEESTIGYNKLSAANTPSAGQYLIFNGTQFQWTTLPSVNGVPSGLVAMVRTAAEIPSGWTRESQLDGRFPIGAGNTFSVTFTEANDYGSSWSHQHDGLSLSVSGTASGNTNLQNNGTTNDANISHSGGDHIAGDHSHPATLSVSGTASGNTTATAWMPPSRAYVFVRKSP